MVCALVGVLFSAPAQARVADEPAASSAAKKRCKTVKKKRHGKTVRVKRCAKPKKKVRTAPRPVGGPRVTDHPGQQPPEDGGRPQDAPDQGSTPTPTPTATPDPTHTPNPQPTQTPTSEPTQTPTAQPTQTPTPEPTQTQTPTPEPTQTPGPGPRSSSPNAACDALDPAVCLLPWPNDLFTVPADTPTGRRLNLALTSMPTNRAGKPIDPVEYNRHDGFSPGTPIVTKIPGLDNDQAFANTGLVPEQDMARAFDPDQPLVVLDADTGERHLVWAELDHHADVTNDADRVLIVRPGRNLTEGHRYIVALRNLRDKDDKPIGPQAPFKAYRDATAPASDERKAHMEWIFRTLGRAGVAREDLYLAWDFTVASEQDRMGRMLRMRDLAFGPEGLGDPDLADFRVQGSAPAFTVDKVTEHSTSDAKIARTVTGTFQLPCYLDRPGCVQGSRFLFAGPDARDFTPIPGNTMEAKYTCRIPRAASPDTPARPSLYGHGLLGGQSEVNAGNVSDMASEHNMMFCATDWYGMATEDLPTIATILADLSNFPALPDRVQQGMLAQLFLARLMIHPQGLPSDAGFQKDGKTLIDTTRAFYDGNSQGGIIGGAVMAVAPDIERGVLGVPGMNYSTLLNRSVDFESDPEHPCPTPPQEVLDEAVEAIEEQDMPDEDTFLDLLNVSYACPLYAAYPKVIERQLLFSLMQQHWDRGEANGYAHHMTGDPPANTPAHEVLLHVALGDHQVAQVAAEVQARTIGAHVRPVAVDPFRSFDVAPQYGIPKVQAWPFAGSLYELWDTGPIKGDAGTAVAPLGNVPPRAGNDPHSRPRATKAARQQKSDFLKVGGQATDQCGGNPCHSTGWTGFATGF